MGRSAGRISIGVFKSDLEACQDARILTGSAYRYNPVETQLDGGHLQAILSGERVVIFLEEIGRSVILSATEGLLEAIKKGVEI